MALLQRGQKSSVFVTHVEFVVSRCEIFCQIGNVGGQADTVAERVAEIIEDGSASPSVQYNVGDLVLALFQVDNSWYRGRVLQTSGQSVKVYFIDYGNTEIVDTKNVLQAPEFVLSIPALSTKCVVIDCTPLGSVWTEVEKKKIETMLHSGEFTIEVVDISPDPTNRTYFVKLYSLDAPNTPIFVRPAANASQSIEFQNLEIGKEYEVFVCYVESVKKFWVQLKSQSIELESLMGDVAVCFAEDLPCSGDLMNPGVGQVCAACFSEDGAFYRGIVQDVHAESCTVFFVDYGNCEMKSTAELFTLPQPLCKLPMQAVACSYNIKGDCNVIEEKLHEFAAADKPLEMTVVSGSGALGYIVTMNSLEKYISTIKPLNQQAKSFKLWHTYSSLPMQVDAIYDVCLSHVNHPGHFYVQLLMNANNIDKLMQAIDEVAHSCEKLSNFHQGYPCLAKFHDDSWYRGEVLAVESNKIRVVAVDFGFVEQVSSSQLRNNSNFKDQPAQAILCSLDLNKCDENKWSSDDIAKFLVMGKKKALVAKVSAKKGFVHQVDLYEPQNKAVHTNKEFKQEKVSLSTNKVSGTLQPLTKPIHLQSVTLPPPEVSVGSKQVLCFTALKFPYIYGQVTHTQVDKVAKLQTDLNNYFDKSQHNSVTDPSIGSFCCTQYVDEGWYRGMVTSVAGNKFEITFVDFGDCIQKAANDLKSLPSNLCLLPQQCLLCKIDNVPSSVSQSQVESILLNNKVEVHITGKEDSVFPTYNVDIVNRHILDKLLNKSVSRGAFQPATTSTRPSQQEHQKNERNQCKDLTQHKSISDAYSHQEVSVGSTQKVTVTHVKDPGSFQVALDTMSGSLDSLMDELEGYYSKLAPGEEQLENARLGQACVSQFTEDKGWYRALITGIKSNGQIEVLYVDYGNNEYLELESLKLIKPKFTLLPALAIHCCLDGVTSPFGFWSPEHAVQFSEMVEEQSFKATFISITREQGQIIYKVELVDQKEININTKFGTMTNTLNVAISADSTSKPFAASTFGQNMKVATSGADNKSGFGDQSKTFGGSSKLSFGSGRPSGERPSFGSGRPLSDGGRLSGERLSFGSSRSSGDSDKPFGDSKLNNSDLEEQNGNDSCTSTGFSNKSSFRNNGGGGLGSAGVTDVKSGPGRSFGGGSSGGNRDCFKCGQLGHFSRECPYTPSRAGGSGGGRDCFKCGESGHMARDCTNPPKAGGSGGGRDCFKCGESGHMARDCTNPPKDGAGSRKGNHDGFGGGVFSGRSSRSFAQNSKTEASDLWDTEDGGSTSQGGGFRDGDSGDVNTGGGFGAKSSGGFGAKKDTVGLGFRNGCGDFKRNVSEDERGISMAAGDKIGKGDASGLGLKVRGFGSIGAEGGEEWDTGVAVDSSKDLVPQQSIGVYSTTLLDLVGSVDVYVVYTDDPEHFCCQLIKNCSSLEQLMENMNIFYNKLPEGELTIDRPQTGMPCVAKFSEDNQWYRAKILNTSQQKVEVLFVDYGNSESVFTNKLRQLKSDFMELAMQGIKCSLNGVKPTHLKWTPEAKRDFENLTHDRHLVAKIISTKPDMTYLLDLENDKNTNVLEAMIKKGHCSLVHGNVSPEVEVVVKNPYPYEAIVTSQDIDVRVSWIENPERFWIQPIGQEDSIYRLVDKVQELYTSGDSAEFKAESFSPGEAVVSMYTEDGAWYRGYVEKTVGGKCIVRFVDYGNSDSVPNESVRLCTEDLTKEPAHAVLCKLQGVRPVQSGHWTTDAKDIMDSLVKDYVVKCKVVDNTNGQLIVDLVCNGKNVRHELIQAAVVKPEKGLSPPVSDNLIRAVTPQERLQYRNTIELLIGAVENVYVTHTDSVASFWCQLANHAPQLDELMDQLGKYCGSSSSLVNYNNNMACGAKFIVDGSWYRAKVTAIYPDRVEVLFVDYGNTEIVPKEDICCLNRELVELAPQAFQCELEGSNKASVEMVVKFNELIGEEMVQATVLDIIDDVASVRILLPDGKVVAEELGLIAPDSVSKVLTPKSIPMTAAAIPSVLDIVYPEPSLPSDSFSVYVAHIVNPGCFYIQRVDQEESLHELMDKVTEFCKTSTAVVGSVKIGRGYCCKFSEDGHWYRSKVTRIEEHAVTVEFIDYGNSETTTIENIRSISVELAKTAPFAVQCILSGIKPKDSSWSDEGITLFEELALEKELTCRVIKLNEVDLVFDDVSIADNLLEKGFAVNCMNIQTNCINSYKFLRQTMPSDSLNVVVSHMNSPSDFYIQRVDQEDQLHELMSQLESDFGGFVCLTPGAVSEGQAVCSKYSEDDSWYRAEVLKADLNSLTVLYVDFGNSEETTWDNVRNITEELVKAPKFAMNCSLAESECHQGKWSEVAVKYFEDVTAVKTLLCTFVTPQSVKLIDDGTNLIEEMLKVENSHKSVSHGDSPSQGRYAIQSVPVDSVSCFVSHVEITGTLYLQLADEENKLSSIVDQVQELEYREPLDIANVKQGQALCARFLEDNSWYRAIVESIDNAVVLVHFVDFGNCATVDHSDLRALSEEYLSTSPLSYPCRLPGFERFSSAQVEILKDELSVKQLTVKFLTSVPEYQVQLYVDNVDVSDTLKESRNQAGKVGENVELQIGCLERDEEALYADIDLQNKSSDVDFECIASFVTEPEFEDVLLEQRVEVIISHSESPSRFWVQLANNQQILDDLLNSMFEFYDVCADKSLLVNSVSKDMAVAAKCIDDNSWYRARVISFDNNNVSVLFVDYGNMELVELEFLRKIPPTFFRLPVQAIKCCLVNIQPSRDDWTEDAKVTFTELTENRVLLMDVCGVDEAGVHKVQLLDVGTSVSDLLIQKDVGVQVATPVALSTKIKQVFTPDSATDVIAKLYDAKASKAIGPYGYNMRDLEVSDSTGFVKNVVVTTVTNPTDFWCRLQDNCYEYYLDTLQDKYSESRDLLENLITESKCVVYTEKGEYQRATITDKLQDDMIKLKLVDIGTDAIMSASGVWKLKPECEHYPQLAFPCTIPGLLPANSDEWSENDCQQFREILLELNQQSDLPASAKATIVSEEDGLVLVELEVDRKDIAHSLVEKGIANIEKSDIETTFKDTFAINRSVLDEFGTFESVALEPDSDYTVVVSDCDDLDRLVFHSKEGLEIIEEVAQLIEEYVADKVGGEGLPEILQGPCLMQCTDDDLWYRANLQCFGEFDDNACQVFLVDYGTTFFIPKTRLLPIPDQLMAYPAQAIICCLGEIEPVEEHWSEKCHTFFREQFMDVEEQAEMLIYINSYHNGLHEVILHSDQLKNKSANYILVEHGLAVPTLGSQIELSFIEARMETSFHELSISKQDSFGESSDVDDAYEPDLLCWPELDTSQFTERDTTQFTEGDNTPFTEEDTTQFTEGDTTQFIEGDTTEEDTTQFTEGDTTQFTEGDTTQFTEGDTTSFTEWDTTSFIEEDTTQSSEGDATQSEGNSFCLKIGHNQGDISCIQDYNSTRSIVIETSYSTEDTTESYTSYLARCGSSKLPDEDFLCLNENDTARLTEGDKLARNQCDTSVFTEGNSACLTEGNISRLTDGVTDVDVSRSSGDMSRSTVGEIETSQIVENIMCIDSTGSCDVSYIDIITTSDVSAIDTSYNTNSETSQLMENETSSYTTDESLCYKKSDVDMSLNTPDMMYWVCEDCEAENLVDDAVTECIYCQKDQNGHASCLDDTDENTETSTENFMQENGVKYEGTTTAQPENIPKDFKRSEKVLPEENQKLDGDIPDDNPKDFPAAEEVLLEEIKTTSTNIPDGNHTDSHGAKEVSLEVSQKTTEPSEGNQKDVLVLVNVSLEECQK